MAVILVCDPLADEGLALLAKAGEVRVCVGLEEEELAEAAREAEAILVRSGTRITARVIEAASCCRVIARAGVGVDNIDVAAATRRGILVVNSPAGNIIAAAEHAVALMLSAARNIPAATAALQGGRWDRKRFTGRQIAGSVLGLVGLGNVGLEVAKRARALEMKVKAADPYVTPERAAGVGVELVPLDTLLAESDIISLHAAATPETEGLIGARELALMRPEAILVNTARGSLVDEKALVAALHAGRPSMAALDVFSDEPNPNTELINLPNVIATPHVGALTHEAQVNVAIDAARQVADVLAGHPPRWPVNAPVLSVEAMRATAPLLPLAEALGLLLRGLLAGPVRRVELRAAAAVSVENLGYVASTALARLIAPTYAETVNAVNAFLLARERGIETAVTGMGEDRGYTTLIELVGVADTTARVSGAVLDRGRVRIVGIDDLALDLPPEGRALLIWADNSHTPGFVGLIGRLLGEAGINIRAIQVSSLEGQDRGLMAVTVSAPVPPEIIAQINDLPRVAQTLVVDFMERTMREHDYTGDQ